MKFFQVKSLSDGQNIVEKNLPESAVSFVEKPTVDAVGDVLFEDVVSPDVFPPYTRATMDGYAVRCEDVYCCSASTPAFLKERGKVLMGQAPTVSVEKGDAVYIATGGVMPEGANAVVPVEHVDVLSGEIAVYSPVKMGENVVRRGEEVDLCDVVVKRGAVVTPLIVGILSALGIEKIKVFGKIKVAVLSTGDELVAVSEKAEGGKIRDVNTSMLTALLCASGYEVVCKNRVPDQEDRLHAALTEALDVADWVLVSGGSSIGAKDLTEKVLSKGEILFHGLALKPGKPTLVSKFGQKTVFGLPGNPFAAACVFQILCDEVVKRARGEKSGVLTAYAGSNFPSAPGRTTLQPVKIDFDGEKYIATPVFLKSAHLYSAIRADGFVLLPERAEGIYAGEILSVHPFIGKDVL